MGLVQRYFFKERRDALRIRVWRYVLRHRTSYPYLSGDAFAKLCDYSAFGKDGTKNLNIKKLRRANKLFVPGHRLEQLLSENFDDINARVLICGNSDRNFTQDPILPCSVTLWLCQNYSVEKGFGRVLPIGLENLRLGKSGFKSLLKHSLGEKISNRVLIPPMQITNPIRKKLVEICKERPDIFDVYVEYLSTAQYFNLIERYKFVLVLEGNGFDTHRLWEVIYKGCVPLVLDSPWSRNIQNLGFPVVLMEISNLQAITESELLRLSSLHSNSNAHLLFMDYWKELIQVEFNS